jgi:hypothetical protein
MDKQNLMPKYSDSIVTSKLGVNFVRTVVESAGCIFHQIDQENDLGIDAIIELVMDGVPLNKQFAVQIKSGQSFYNGQSKQCLIPVGTHFKYWSNYPLPVYGIVYVPSIKSAYWVNIKNHLKHVGECSTIKFDNTKVNNFTDIDFVKVFLPGILNQLPELSFEEAKILFDSTHASENYLGLVVLFHIAPNAIETWDSFIDFFQNKDFSEIPTRLIYYLAHIPWHPDIWYRGEQINDDTKDHVQKRFDEFDKQDVIKLLSFIDEEVGICRGSIGQSVEAIISFLSNRDELLTEIMEDADLYMHLREVAVLIFAFNNEKVAIPFLKILSSQGSWYTGELLSFINEYGGINPYA